MVKNSSFDLGGSSEVFAEFVKIAKEKEYTSDVYNIDTGEDKTGKELIERAHPQTAEVLESYIENGGVVENGTQQQEVSIEIAQKMPDNQVSRKTMATLNLLNELIIVAEEMDIRGENDLCKFADDISESINKKAAFPIALALGAGAVAAVVSAWFYMVHGSEPVDYGAGKNLKSAWSIIERYKTEKLSSAYGEADTSAENILNQIQKILLDTFNSRKAYLDATKQLTSRLQQMHNVQPENGMDALEPETVKTILESPEAKDIIKQINDYNNKYDRYVTQTILPLLSEYGSYLKDYLEATKGISESETGERSTIEQVWEKTKDIFGYAEISIEKHVMDAFTTVISSLQKDMVIRTKEKDLLIKRLSQPITTNIEEQFNAASENTASEPTEKPEETL